MMTKIALGGLALALLNGCATRDSQPSHVALSSMEYATNVDPLCLASGDSLGMELHVWHVVSTDPDPTWLLAVSD
ncbi:MAG: hypothetical protein P8K80_01645 [Phycisphaerales bacterium]|nr:hypothetical protein [Phycisphaerales bacterium]